MVLPLIALRNEVRYVGEFGPLYVGRRSSVAAARTASAAKSEIVLAAQRNAEADPGPNDVYSTGVACALVRLQEEDGVLQLMLDPKRRVRIIRIGHVECLRAEVSDWPDEASSIPDILRCAQAVQNAFDTARTARGLPEEASQLLTVGWRPDLPDAERPDSRAGAMVFLAQRYLDFETPVFPLEVRQQLLEAPSLTRRLELLERQLRTLAAP